MIKMSEVGAFPSTTISSGFSVTFGIYLPGIRAADGFEVVVRIIHRDDRFDPAVHTQDFPLNWHAGHPLDLWSKPVPIEPVPNSNFGREGTYLYRYQLWWRNGPDRNLITLWFTDPFARATDIGRLSAFTLAPLTMPFQWTDSAYKTPELDDLVVYELQVEEFNDTFDGAIERLTYLQSLGVNCLELMPVTSMKLDFDWGYGPLHYFAPSARFGGPDGLKRLVDAAHFAGIAVILDVVYEHVDQMFAYNRVYKDIAAVSGPPTPPHPHSPMINGSNKFCFGPKTDFTADFTLDYFSSANRMWLDEYHVDGFRYDEVTDLYEPPMDAGYRTLVENTYRHSLTIDRFMRTGPRYSRIIQCAEALGKAREILNQTFSNCAWQDDLLNKAETAVSTGALDDGFAHQLDTRFIGYPDTRTVVDAAGDPVEMPLAPFQYIESHDHSQLIVFAGTKDGPLAPGDRDKFYKLQPYAIALYTLQGIPMLWQGQEFADNYQLPGSGLARVQLRRDTHWEYFYDDSGSPLVRLYRRLGLLRRTHKCLRSRESFYYFQQSLQGNRIIAYHRRAPAQNGLREEFAMIVLNFADANASISLPFPKAGTWREMLDADVRPVSLDLAVGANEEVHTVAVPSNYGMVFLTI
jgi:1,4-alpha-glucan branching enzyme